MRIAIACPGVGLVQRGFERLFLDIFRLVEGGSEIDVTLFKGGGPEGPREKVPFFLPRNGRLVKLLPVHRLAGRTPIHTECLTFALAMLPYLRGGRFDVVHVVDPPLARLLFRLRRALGLRFRLLYTHACTMPVAHYPPADHLQQVSRETYEEALRDGLPERSMTLLPIGIHPRKFASTLGKEELRRQHGVQPDTFMILAVAALNRSHKRTHYLIDEAGKLKGDFLLWLDGSMDQGEPDLVGYARSRLGDRVRITQVASDRVGELYRMADVMVHAASFEAFGLSIVEGASTGLPVLVHDAPHFRWLMPNPRAWVDMLAPDALSRRLSELMADRSLLEAARCSEEALARFTWDVLRDDYIAQYRAVAALPAPANAHASKNYFWQVHG